MGCQDAGRWVPVRICEAGGQRGKHVGRTLAEGGIGPRGCCTPMRKRIVGRGDIGAGKQARRWPEMALESTEMPELETLTRVQSVAQVWPCDEPPPPSDSHGGKEVDGTGSLPMEEAEERWPALPVIQAKEWG